MAAVSKLDYLKRYMSKDNDSEGKKQKKSKKNIKKVKNIKIIDNDLNFKDAEVENDDSDEFAVEEEKPQVFVDGQTLLSEHMEKSDDRRNKWAPLIEDKDTLISKKNKVHATSTIFAEQNNKERYDSLDVSTYEQHKRHDSPDSSPTRHRKHYSPDSPDLSPKRHKRHDSPDLSPKRHKRHDSPDLSPKRHKIHDFPDLSPKRHRRHDSPDLSPKRHRRHDSSDLSPKRHKRHDSPDLSPKRQKRHDSPDLSPKRHRRHDSPDLSPKRHRRHDSPDLSPKRHKRHNSPDLSPKRYKRHNSPDLSPKRHKRHDSPDLSPRRHKRHDSIHSASKHHKRHNRNKDVDSVSSRQDVDNAHHMFSKSHKKNSFPDSTHQQNRKDIFQQTGPEYFDKNNASSRSKNREKDRTEALPEVIKSGKKSGLQTAESLRQENLISKAHEDQHFATMDTSISGLGAGTVYRDKHGKKIDLKLERIKKREAEEKKAKEDEKFLTWGKGAKQTEDYQKKLKDDLYEMSKPLARYEDDKDLDEMLKSQERAGDPMLEFIQKSKAKSKQKSEKPRYKGPNPPPNRFNIWPGYRWDGVDRSNGFERKRFEAIAAKQTFEKEKYKWSVEDM